MKLTGMLASKTVMVAFGHRGGGTQNLTVEPNESDLILSTTGGAVVLPAASSAAAGVMSAADKARSDGAPILDCVADLSSTEIAASAAIVECRGRFAAGDGGGTRYRRVASEPAHAGKLRSGDGAWWEIVPEKGSIPLLAFGADATGATDSAQAWRDARDACAALSARLTVSAGIYRWDSPVDFSDTDGSGRVVDIEVSRYGYDRNAAAGAIVHYHGPADSIAFKFGSAWVGQKVDGLAFRNFSAATNVSGIAITGARAVLHNFKLRGFDGVALRLGYDTDSMKSCYFADVQNGEIGHPGGSQAEQAKWEGPLGEIGVWITGGFPASNANTLRNVTVYGGYDRTVVIDGSNNRWEGGDVSYTAPLATSCTWEINGNANVIDGVYREPGSSGVSPGKAIVFGSSATGNVMRNLYDTSRPQEADITRGGYWNTVQHLPLGVNFALAQRREEGTQNLLSNTDFRGPLMMYSAGYTPAPYGWTSFDLEGTHAWTADETEYRGSKRSIKLVSGTATAALFQYIYATQGTPPPARAAFKPLHPSAYIGRALSFACWVKTSVADRISVRLQVEGSGGAANTVSANAKHSGSGEWELLTGTVQVGPDEPTSIQFFLRAEAGDSATAYFSAPIVTLGTTVPDYDSAPLRATGGQMTGRLAEAPPLTWTDADTTPSVADGNYFITANSGATTITAFDDGLPGQRIFVEAADANTTVANNSNIQTSTNAMKALANGRLYQFVRGLSKWFEVQT